MIYGIRITDLVQKLIYNFKCVCVYLDIEFIYEYILLHSEIINIILSWIINRLKSVSIH